MVRGLIVLVCAACTVQMSSTGRAPRPTSPPPPPRTEVVTARPGFVWFQGRWEWSGQWVWIPGRWQQEGSASGQPAASTGGALIAQDQGSPKVDPGRAVVAWVD